jgi:hypothetical protein
VHPPLSYVFMSVYRDADSIDFGMDELDTKNKIAPKMGTAALMRLRFTQDMSGAAGDGGYALVDGEAGDEAGVELKSTASGASAEVADKATKYAKLSGEDADAALKEAATSAAADVAKISEDFISIAAARKVGASPTKTAESTASANSATGLV